MNGELTVYDTLDRVAVGDIRTRLRDILGAFLFRGEDIDKKVKVLSGGERSRLALASLMLEPHNLLVLDEPTNHMDMRSKDILKRALMQYDGTVVVVSHDREFLDGLVGKVYEFRDGGVREYLGGIYYFLEKRKLESLHEVERRDAAPRQNAAGQGTRPANKPDKAGTQTKPGNPPDSPDRKNRPDKTAAATAFTPATAADATGKQGYEQRKEQEKALRRLRKAVETIEAELADIERQIADFDARFALASAYNEADYKAYDALKSRYERQMHEWEKASYELELTENG